MARRIYLLAPNALVFALLACGGANDPGLFSGSGSSGSHGSNAGAPGSAGTSASAGASAAPASEGGSAAVAGSGDSAGQASGGSAAGDGSAGANATAGAGGAAQAGAGGSAAGSPGTGGSSAGSGGSPDTAGSGGSVAGSAGSAGTEPTCKELLAQAASQLEAARACNLAKNAEQCTGTVKTTCNCEVPVENENSADAQAYEATLKQINQKKCVQVCAAVACTSANHALCRPNNPGGTEGTCVSSSAPSF